ncbi:MAG TPA: TraB/GumN family protein [Kofleriaceae bacterium]|jgi:pheromone shutdown-related protein TraB|nr:TraB/GumN family protein [Kofleriaceae bacterium]
MWYERGMDGAPEPVTELPPEPSATLPSSVTTLTRGDTTFYVVGTAHVSQKSVDDVRTTIDSVHPDVVCVELDQARYDALTKDSAFRDLDVFKVVREGRTLYLLAHLALSSYQRRIGKSLGVQPGAELVTATKTAAKRGIPVELIDRDINITLKRTWRNLGMWRRARLLFSLIGGDDGDPNADPITHESVEGMKEQAALSEMLAELGRQVPEIKGPLVDERDQYLASKMRDAGEGKRTVVAVVGAAHVPGMTQQLDKPIDRANLELVPPPPLWWRIAKWLVPIGFLALLAWFARAQDPETFARTMLAWIIPTSIGAGLFTAVAGGSPFSVISAMLASPIARVYPLVRTAVVVGIVEAWRRKPSVVDCERLPDDTQTVKGFFKNPVTRILIIASASGLGALLGFAVGVGWVATRI